MRRLEVLTAVAVGLFSHAATAQTAPNARQMYIVQTRGAPAATYEGGEAGFVRTRPVEGQRIDAASQTVQSYLQHLRGQHARIAEEVGLTPVADYGVTLNGFAAEMSEATASRLAARDDVVAVYPFRTYQLDTSNTPSFLGLDDNQGPWRNRITGEDVVVGIFDGGIWPEHPCFADIPTPSRGDIGRAIPYGPAPAGFTASGPGTCEFGNAAANPVDVPFQCNNKLLAARFYRAGFTDAQLLTPGANCDPTTGPCECVSTRDCGAFGDHGTNVAGTAACNANTPAFLNGQSVGPIAGMAPRARLSHYKVCWSTTTAPTGTCSNVDLIAATEQGILDGVDVMNFSLGSTAPGIGDAWDISLLNATAAGIYVATSAGNAGSGPQTIGSPATAPWVTSVGAMQDPDVTATGLDVQSPSSLAGIKTGLEGAGPVTLASTGDIVGSVVAADDIEACGTTAGPLANPGALAGNIALVRRGTCGFDEKYRTVQAAGAVAIVVYNDGANPTRFDPIAMGGLTGAVTIPGIMIGFNDGDAIRTALSGGTAVAGRLSPSIAEPRGDRIASFSSRGPNGFSPDVLKPDVVAPGVNILSAGSPEGGIFDGGLYSVISGTSFSSPHMAGLFALIKQANPTWSPAAARSAYMTSARQNIQETFRDTLTTPFDIGGGMVDPAAALDTGLVYETDAVDYAAYSCGQNIIFDSATCAALAAAGASFDASQMNYPSITAAEVVGSKTITRTITNRSGRTQRWSAQIDAPAGFSVSVSPNQFRLQNGESATFAVTITTQASATVGQWSFGALTWTTPGNGRFRGDVRSPISVKAERFSAPELVTGTGGSGSGSFDVRFGYTGAYSAQVHGLNGPGLGLVNIPDDPTNEFSFRINTGGVVIASLAEVPAGTAAIRFATYNAYTDGNDDLDMYVYYCPNFSCAQVGQSANADANESVTVAFPQNNPAIQDPYLVFLHGFETDGPDANAILFTNSFGVVDDAGNLTVTAPTSATLATNGTVNYQWTGLAGGPGAKFLGAVSHSDASGIQAITVFDVENDAGFGYCDLGPLPGCP